jgi:hypothetical protein
MTFRQKLLLLGMVTNDLHWKCYISGAPGRIFPREPSPKRIAPKTVDVSKAVSDRVSLISKITSPKKVN